MARKFFAALAATAGLAFASQAGATVFAGDWSLTIGDNTDPGHLKIYTDTTYGAFSKDLTIVDPDYVDLFQIWTDESAVNADDLNGTTLALTFTFTSPSGNNGPIVIDGGSVGYNEDLDLVFWTVEGFFQGGELIWNNGGAAQLQWGFDDPNLVDPGRMTLTVNGGRFNEGAFGSTDQGCFFGHHCNPQKESLPVSAKFDWDNDPTFGAVPEPATWALMIGGFGMAGAMIRRRRALALA